MTGSMFAMVAPSLGLVIESSSEVVEGEKETVFITLARRIRNKCKSFRSEGLAAKARDVPILTTRCTWLSWGLRLPNGFLAPLIC